MNIDNVLKSLPNIRGLRVSQVHLKPEYGYFTKAEKDEIKTSLESLGAITKKDEALVCGSKAHTCGMELDNINYTIWYDHEKSKEEKCAELKKQLADMGCHY